VTDLILTNGRVHVLDAAFTMADSVAIAGGRIVAAGRAQDILPLAGPHTRTVNLDRKVVIPGFHDSHCHVLAFGLDSAMEDLSGAAGIAEIRMKLRERVARDPSAPIIQAFGYTQHGLDERRHPVAADLDDISPTALILLRHVSGHAVSVNARLLERAGITQNTVDPAGGAIVRDPEGRPTGVLLENAASLAYAVLPAPTAAERAQALAQASGALHAMGITSAVDALTSFSEMAAYRSASEAGTLTVRCTLTADIREWVDGDHCAPAGELGLPETEFVRLGGMKVFADGAIGTRTAALREPYASDPGNAGAGMYPPEELSRLMWCAHSAGWQLLVHAIGDRGIDMCLDGFDSAQNAWPRPTARHRIEHAMLLWDDHIARMARLGLLAVYQPEFIARFGDIYRDILGPVLGGRIMPFQSSSQEGIPLVFGSDLPVTPGAPLTGIRAAVERSSLSGARLDPAECVDAYDALRAYTAGPAYASFLEDDRGTIAAGKRADLTILSADPTELPPDEWPDLVRVVATVVGGHAVHGEF
jgi:hypothetical protein